LIFSQPAKVPGIIQRLDWRAQVSKESDSRDPMVGNAVADFCSLLQA
jgi:hypothetical protein